MADVAGVVVLSEVLEQSPVGTHVNVANLTITTVSLADRRYPAAPERVARVEAVPRRHKQRHIREREGPDVGRELLRRADVDQGPLRRLHLEAGRCVARRADVILDHPLHGVDRLQAHQRVGRAASERGVEGAGELGVGGDRDVIPRRTVRRRPGRELHAADEGIELADGAATEILEVVPLAGPGLVGGDVRIPADIDEPAGRVEDRHRQVATEAVGVVDVEDRRPGLAAAVDAADRLDPGVIDGEGEPANVGRRLDIARQADRILIALEELADVLSLDECPVRVEGAFTGSAGEERVTRQPLNVDAGRREADVGILDSRAGHLIALLEADAEFVGTGARPRLHVGIGERCLIDSLRRRRRDVRLAADTDKVGVEAAVGAGEDRAETGVAGVDGEVVVAAISILLQRQGAMFAGGGVAKGRQREISVGIVGLDARRSGRRAVPDERDRAGVPVERRRGDPRRRAADGRERECARPIDGERLHGGVAVVDHAAERAGEDVLLGQLVGERGPRGGVSHDLAGHRAGVGLAVGRTGQHRARGVEQFEHRVEGGRRLVEIKPHLRSGVAGEAVDVDVGRIVGGDRAADGKAVAPVVVA